MMRIGIVGAGRIGGNAARMFARAGHATKLSYSRDPSKLENLAAEFGGSSGTPREAVEFGEVVMISVPWRLLDEVLAEAGPLTGKIVIDTTNQFGAGGLERLPDGRTAAQINAARMPGARYTKAFNTLTSGFQSEAAGRRGEERAVLFICGDDDEAKQVVAALIEEIGFAAVDLGGTADAAPMEAPRRAGALYGEEYRPEAAREIAAVFRSDPELGSRLADERKVGGETEG